MIERGMRIKPSKNNSSRRTTGYPLDVVAWQSGMLVQGKREPSDAFLEELEEDFQRI